MRIHRSIPLLALALLALPAAARAQEPCPCPAEEEKPPEPAWKSKLGLAYLATSGNSDTETVGLDLLVTRKPEPWGLEIYARYDRAEDSGVETSERALAGVRVKRSLGKRWELFGETSAERDQYAGFDLRWLLAAGGTFHAVASERHELDFDLGLTWTDENRLPPAEDVSYLGALAGLNWKWKLSERSSLRERLVYYPNFDTSSDWRAESLTSLEAALTDRLALAVGYEIRYANEPIDDREDTDTTTRVALVLNF
ncbi:MAG: DUF481 domain-containing protein [Acidobacteria bacterium]|nr:DUF481 domain-containing protein [Acidobacteriota bacterium]MCB9378738.1 DUF481 domain-containing protein [Holophagales bacterium]